MSPTESPLDPNSFANNHEIAVQHLHLSLTADFEAKNFRGYVDVTVKAKQAVMDQIQKLVLDTSYLAIQAVTVGDQDLQYELAERHPIYGSALMIQLLKPLAQGASVVIRISYATTDKCTACQWLTPSQTAGKIYPYMFTQCQAIHARSLVPCQDTPSVKITYSAELTVPKALRALMSALPDGTFSTETTTSYKFVQPITIPAYLIAIAIGNIMGIRVGPRSTVWSEPEVVEAAAWEFKETETFISTGESLLTPYEWGVYDLLLLPASFPYGGMENPCLTFVTPTLLAGDRSLVDVVAHEIAHSWMGNLVTTQNWEHFWLNEGFTVFIERKIAGRLHGERTRQFNSIIGYKALKESVDHFKETGHVEFSSLCPRLKNCDPDDAFSSVPYEKGYNLLYYLETILGGPSEFEPYLKAHVTEFAHKSINTDDFKAFLFNFFGDAKAGILNSVAWDTWLNHPGMPIVENKFDDSLAQVCIHLANKWDACRTSKACPTDKNEFINLNSNQKVMFLEKLLLKDPLPCFLVEAMNSLYDMGSIKNAEIRFRWEWISLNAEWEPIFPDVVDFITSVGRMKFVRPLYRALSKCKNGSQLAKDTFIKNRAFYHPICAAMVAKDLQLA